MRKKLIIFDLNNTLFQSKDSSKYILAEVISDTWGIKKEISIMAFDKTSAEMRSAEGYASIADFYKEFDSNFLKKIVGRTDQKKLEEFTEILDKMKKIAPFRLKLYPEVLQTLNNLKSEGYSLAILTGSWKQKINLFKDSGYAAEKRKAFEKLLKNSGLGELIGELFISYEHGTAKPSPDSFNVVLEYHNTHPSEAIMVGDKESDILASRLGITSILFDPTNKYSGETKPHHKIDRFSDILQIVQSYKD